MKQLEFLVCRGVSLRRISLEGWRQFVRIDCVPLILRGGCPPRELREGSSEIMGPSFRIRMREKTSVFSEDFMRLGNLHHRRNRQTTQFRQKRPHDHRRPGTTPLPRRISDNRAGFIGKQRTAEVIEQMRQSRAHRMIVFGTYHDIAIRRRDFIRQGLKLSGRFTPRISKMGFEYRRKIKFQWIDQFR